MKTVEHKNDCLICGDDADNAWTVFEAVAKVDGAVEIVGQAAFRTPYVQLGALIGALCDDCKTEFKALANPVNVDERLLWRNAFKVMGAQRITDAKAEIARQEELARVARERAEAENAAKLAAAQEQQASIEAAMLTARTERAESFAKLAPEEQLKTALAAMLDGSATAEEREMFAQLVTPA